MNDKLQYRIESGIEVVLCLAMIAIILKALHLSYMKAPTFDYFAFSLGSVLILGCIILAGVFFCFAIKGEG
jgi:hypothetical protein